MRGMVRGASVIALVGAGALAAPRAPALAADNGPVLSYWSQVDNPFPTPQPNRMVTVYGFFLADLKPVKGVKMTTIWRDGKHRIFCYGATDAAGTASCSERLPNLQLGGSVQISVTFYYQKGTYTTSSSLLPQ